MGKERLRSARGAPTWSCDWFVLEGAAQTICPTPTLPKRLTRVNRRPPPSERGPGWYAVRDDGYGGEPYRRTGVRGPQWQSLPSSPATRRSWPSASARGRRSIGDPLRPSAGRAGTLSVTTGMAASRTAGRELGVPNGRVYHQVRLRDDPGHRPAREAVDHQRPRPLHGRGENQEAHRLPDRLGHAGPGQVPGGRPVPVRPRVGAMRVPAAARPRGTRAALRGDSRHEHPQGQRGQGAQGRRARCRGPALGDDQGQAEDQAGVDAGRRVRGASGPDARLRGRRLGLASLEAAALRLPAAARDRLGREDEGRQAARDVG